MNTPASIGRHPIHAMLIPFPIGLLVFSLAADLVARGGGDPVWHAIAFWTMAGGIIGALCAAIPGFIDFTSIRDRRAWRVALAHMAINLTVVAIFVVDLWLRTRPAPPPNAPLWLSVAGVVLLVVSGWLGGHLVYVHGVAVAPAPTGAVSPEIRAERRDVSRSA